MKSLRLKLVYRLEREILGKVGLFSTNDHFVFGKKVEANEFAKRIMGEASLPHKIFERVEDGLRQCAEDLGERSQANVEEFERELFEDNLWEPSLNDCYFPEQKKKLFGSALEFKKAKKKQKELKKEKAKAEKKAREARKMKSAAVKGSRKREKIEHASPSVENTTKKQNSPSHRRGKRSFKNETEPVKRSRKSARRKPRTEVDSPQRRKPHFRRQREKGFAKRTRVTDLNIATPPHHRIKKRRLLLAPSMPKPSGQGATTASRKKSRKTRSNGLQHADINTRRKKRKKKKRSNRDRS